MSEFEHYLDGGDYVPFTHRYGLTSNDEAPPWAGRHNWMHHHLDQVPATPHHLQCRCQGLPGTATRPRQSCDQRATQEDLLCDQCRDWCVAVDEARRYHHLADLGL